MPSISDWNFPDRRPLARRLEALRRALDALGEQLREAIARAVGQAADGAASDAVRAALAGGHPRPPRPAGPPWAGGPSPHWWGGPGDREWSGYPGDADDPDERFRPRFPAAESSAFE